MALNPARVIKQDHLIGGIKKGKLANLVIFNPNGKICNEAHEDLQVDVFWGTSLDGKVVKVLIRG